MTPGKETSEYKRTQRAEDVGYGLAFVGFFAGLVIAFYGFTVAALVCAAAGASGIFLVGHAASSYAKSRGQVKSAHENSKIRVVQHRGI